jgi:hypothetical protein
MPPKSALRRGGSRCHLEPATADSLNQDHRRDHPLAADLGEYSLVREQHRLGVNYVQVADQSPGVPIHGNLLGLLGIVHGRGLGLSFALQNTQSRQLVLDLLKSGEDGLLILRERLAVCRGRLANSSTCASRVENGRHCGCQNLRDP